MRYSEVKEVYTAMNSRLESSYGKVSKHDVKECLQWIELSLALDLYLENIPYEIKELVEEFIDLQPEYAIEESEEAEYSGSQDHLSLNGMSWKDFI
jgi:hypothetical protein